jgi:hypothetical protein
MKSWHKYLVYFSLLFLGIALYKAHYLKVPGIFSWFSLLTSFLFLFAGFIMSALSWCKILARSEWPVDFKMCLAGTGLSIFVKYIPGKIWTIMGRAAYIAENRTHIPLGRLSAISLNAQFMGLWVGLILGALGLFLLGGLHIWVWPILILWILLTLIIFSSVVHRVAEVILKRILKKDFHLSHLNFLSTLSVIPWFLLNWGTWSFGFYLLVAGLSPDIVPWSSGLGFPLASAVGIMALITPAGLATREAVLVGYLTLCGLPVAQATTIAVASRLWFLFGESFVFCVGWLLHRRVKQ